MAVRYETQGSRVYLPYKKDSQGKTIVWRGYIRFYKDKKAICSESFSGSTKKIVDDLLNKYVQSGAWDRKVNPPAPVEASQDVTVGQHFAVWRDDKAKKWGISTAANRRWIYDRYLSADSPISHVSAFLARELKTVEEADVVAYFAAMPDSVSENTKFEIHKLLKAAFKRAVDRKLISVNPAIFSSDDDKPRESEAEVVAFTMEEQQKLLAYLRDTNHPMRAIVQFAFDSGCRMSECLGIQKGDLTLSECRVQINRAVKLDGKTPVIGPTKTRASRRTIILAPSTIALLKPLYEAAKGQDGLIFPDPEGKLWNRYRFASRWDKLLVDAGVGHLGFHSVRHTTATRLLQAGMYVTAVAKRLGHAKTSLVLDRYSNAITEDQHALANVNELILQAA